MFKRTIKNNFIRIYLGIVLVLIQNIDNVAGNTHTKNVINHELESVIATIFLLTIINLLGFIYKQGKSKLNRPIIFVTIGTLVMGLTRVIYFLFEYNLVDISNETRDFSWHIIYFNALILFMMAIKITIETTSTEYNEKEKSYDSVIQLSLLFLSIIIIVTMNVWNESFTKAYKDSILDTSGLIHILAFILAGIFAQQLFQFRQRSNVDEMGRYMDELTKPLLFFLVLMSLNHFWEMITEGWGILKLSMKMIETGEQLFWIPGFLVLMHGSIKLILLQYSTLAKLDDVQPSQITNNFSEEVISILKDHIGTSALVVAIQACNDIEMNINNIEPSNLNNFTTSLEKYTQNLIGNFPSKYLSKSILKLSNN
ncbi:MAG: hypothetical protein OEY49_11100 [Candidatus Heimdallarchaeota archaeon]|nr:hypothetical protein [Candidatus Heimdallarchaeota archaeon]